MTDTPPGSFQLADMSPKRNSRRLVVIGAIALALLVGGGVAAFALTRDDKQPAAASTPAPANSTEQTTAAPASPSTSPTPRRFTVAGSISTLSGESHDGVSCQGYGRNSDIAEGATLMVLNAVGDRIAETKLGPGLLDGMLCVFQFIVEDVPSGAGTYRLTIGTRKAKSYSEADFTQGAMLNILF